MCFLMLIIAYYNYMEYRSGCKNVYFAAAPFLFSAIFKLNIIKSIDKKRFLLYSIY